MYIEIHDIDDTDQEALYFKLNSAFGISNADGKNRKIKGIYAIFKDDICLYVGQSKNIASRLATHLRGKYKDSTYIAVWNIKNVGFSDFDTRSKDSQMSILLNTEKYIMALLKPIENLDIDMDFKCEDNQKPDVSYLTFEIRRFTDEFYHGNVISVSMANTSSSQYHIYEALSEMQHVKETGEAEVPNDWMIDAKSLLDSTFDNPKIISGIHIGEVS